MQETHEFGIGSDARKSAPSGFSVPEHFEPLLDSQEAAFLLRIHPKTLTRMARERRIVGVKVGKAWMFRVSELNRFLDSKLAS